MHNGFNINEQHKQHRENRTMLQSINEYVIAASVETRAEVLATGKTTCKATSKGGRVWIEKSKPLLAGFKAGDLYSTVDMGDGKLYLFHDNDGLIGKTKVVSGKADRPVIDLHSKAIGDKFGLGSTVVVTYYNQVITIETE
jgi:hypothetical protein